MLRKKIPTVEVATLLCLQEVITVKIALKRLQEAHSASVFFATRSRAGPAVPTISTDGNAMPVAAWNHKVGERFGLGVCAVEVCVARVCPVAPENAFI